MRQRFSTICRCSNYHANRVIQCTLKSICASNYHFCLSLVWLLFDFRALFQQCYQPSKLRSGSGQGDFNAALDIEEGGGGLMFSDSGILYLHPRLIWVIWNPTVTGWMFRNWAVCVFMVSWWSCATVVALGENRQSVRGLHVGNIEVAVAPLTAKRRRLRRICVSFARSRRPCTRVN